MDNKEEWFIVIDEKDPFKDIPPFPLKLEKIENKCAMKPDQFSEIIPDDKGEYIIFKVDLCFSILI